LYSLSSINEEIRQQAKKYYDEYKLLKRDVYNGRIDLKKQNDQLQLEIQNNNQENANIKQDIEKYITDKKQFKSQLGITEVDKKDQNKNSVDTNILSNVLNNLSGMGYDIFKGANLSEEEMKLIESTLNTKRNPAENKNNSENNSKKKENEGNEEANNNVDKNVNMAGEAAEEIDQEKNNMNEGEEYEYENEEDIKEDLELGNQVVSLIEKDVNDLYLKKVIEQIKIDQINAITYTFENDRGEAHDITLKIVDGELYCVDGTKFSAWLIKNFSS
jgi:hypothetical protein